MKRDANDILREEGPDRLRVAHDDARQFNGGQEENIIELDGVKAPSIAPTLSHEIVTEDSVAFQFVEEHASELRYCHSTGAWFRWDGTIWRKDEKHLAFHWARILVRQLVQNERPKIKAIASKTGFAAGVEKFAQRDPAVAVTADYWDQNEWLLGTPAGTVDLRTGRLRSSDSRDGITKSTLIAPGVTGSPLWLKFLNETTVGDQELMRFLQQWLGYCLTGSIREHALIFVYGSGGNGKSVFLNTTTKILGDYAATAAMETFTASKGDRHPTDLAMLHGARLVTASETEQGNSWAEARIKALTGGDRIAARFMRQDFFQYNPQFKLTIIGNHKPMLRNVDEAMRRRMNMLPFLVKPSAVDRQLEQKLLAEAPGILQWMIEGCLDWQSNGLIRPEIVKVATDDYFSEQDVFGQWIEDCCELKHGGYPAIWDRSSDLFASWADYARKAGEEPGSQKSFANELKKRGFGKHRDGGARGFKFIRLKPQVVQ
jgi:putative DNA primase/helicase